MYVYIYIYICVHTYKADLGVPPLQEAGGEPLGAEVCDDGKEPRLLLRSVFIISNRKTSN